jgi:hypothetical protein
MGFKIKVSKVAQVDSVAREVRCGRVAEIQRLYHKGHEGTRRKCLNQDASCPAIRLIFVACTNLTKFTSWCSKWYTSSMKRATITLPDDLANATEEYVQAQEAPPALTTVMQAALREYLRERGFLREYRPLKITPAKKGSGRSDVSINHDLYLAGIKK